MEKATVPIVYPLHYKRFVRRTSSATALRPDSPLFTSRPWEKEQMIFSPKPTRSFPALATPPETSTSTAPAPPQSDRIPAQRDTGLKRKKFTPTRQNDASVERVAAASFLHGTKAHCVRHGRKRTSSPARPAGTATAREMLAKSRSGAYIPTGLTQMRQVEATSPWAVVPPVAKSRFLTRANVGVGDGGDDACPDCVAELRIKRREWGSAETVRRPVDRAEEVTGSSMVPEPAQSAGREDALASRTDVESKQSEDDDLIVATTLQEGLDAIIVEQQGKLKRVIVNARHGKPSIETMQRLSQELAKVANSIAFADPAHASAPLAPKQSGGDCAVLVQGANSGRDTRLSSVPELLEMIDQAAEEIHFNTGRLAKHYVRRRDFTSEDRLSLLSEGEFGNLISDRVTPTQGLVGRQSIEEQYRNVQERLSNAAREKERGVVDADLANVPADEVKVKGLDAAQTPLSAKEKSAPDEARQNATKTPLTTTEKTQPTPAVPEIIRTKPTLAQIDPQKQPNISPTQTPPPEHPSLHAAAALPPPSAPASPASPAVAPAKPSEPLPQQQEKEKHHHNPFHTWLNPFFPHHHNSNKNQQQQPPNATSPTSGKQSLFSTTPTSPLSPKTEIPPPSLPAAGGVDIRATPALYHHAPHAPANLDFAAFDDPKVREHQQVIRAAMRMQKESVVRDAAALERGLGVGGGGGAGAGGGEGGKREGG